MNVLPIDANGSTTDGAHERARQAGDLANAAPLLRTLAHDLAEPLRTVRGYVELLQHRLTTSGDDETRELLAHALRGAHVARERVEGLSALARAATRPLQHFRVDLEAVLDAALEELEPGLRACAARVARQPLPGVDGDADALSELFERLLDNALRFRGDGPPSIDVRAVVDGERVVIEVRDHGLGFEPRLAERAFEPFARLHPGRSGVGIGLAVARCLAERHGGTLTATAVVGAGATFSLSLPAGPRGA